MPRMGRPTAHIVLTDDEREVLRDDPEDPMRTAMRQMAGVFAQLDRSLIVKRLRNGRETKAARGGHAVGAPPYGMRAADAELVRDDAEQAVVARICEWNHNGDSFAAIARRLNDAGVRARRGRWHPQTVKRVVSGASSVGDTRPRTPATRPARRP
jgi:DNA invertase Pin-like site-specific DNA recombinase